MVVMVVMVIQGGAYMGDVVSSTFSINMDAS